MNAVTNHPNTVIYFGFVTSSRLRSAADVQSGEPYHPSRGPDDDPVTLLAELTGGAVFDVGTDLTGLSHAIDKVFPLVPPAGDAIPTTSTWGIVVLALMLVTGARLYFGRRRTASTC